MVMGASSMANACTRVGPQDRVSAIFTSTSPWVRATQMPNCPVR